MNDQVVLRPIGQPGRTPAEKTGVPQPTDGRPAQTVPSPLDRLAATAPSGAQRAAGDKARLSRDGPVGPPPAFPINVLEAESLRRLAPPAYGDAARAATAAATAPGQPDSTAATSAARPAPPLDRRI